MLLLSGCLAGVITVRWDSSPLGTFVAAGIMKGFMTTGSLCYHRCGRVMFDGAGFCLTFRLMSSLHCW